MAAAEDIYIFIIGIFLRSRCIHSNDVVIVDILVIFYEL